MFHQQKMGVLYWKKLMCWRGASRRKKETRQRNKTGSNDVDFVRYAMAFGFYAKYGG